MQSNYEQPAINTIIFIALLLCLLNSPSPVRAQDQDQARFSAPENRSRPDRPRSHVRRPGPDVPAISPAHDNDNAYDSVPPRYWQDNAASEGKSAPGFGRHFTPLPKPTDSNSPDSGQPTAGHPNNDMPPEQLAHPPMRQQAGSAGRGFWGGPLDLRSLELSDEQKASIKSMRSKLGPQARETRKSIKSKREELRELMFDPQATDTQIKSKHQEIKQLTDRLEELQLNDFLQLRQLLSKEQRQKLPEIMPHHRPPVANTPPSQNN